VLVTDLPFSQALGLQLAPAGAPHLLELPHTAVTKNHVGTAHAAAQFALAEAASAACLQRAFPTLAGQVFAVVRGVQLKYRRAGTGTLYAFARPDEFTAANLVTDLQTRTRTTATVLVELKDADGTVTFTGTFEWFVARGSGDASAPAAPASPAA
jgi:acyl-coenzyme A thioesterase PaaI-like protein